MSESLFERFWYRSVPARRLATLRIAIGAYAALFTLGRAPGLIGVAGHSADQFAPVGPVQLLSAPLPAFVVIALVVLAIPLGAAFTVGWRFRWTGPAFAFVLLWVTSYRNSWGMVFHTENLLVAHVLILAISPCADVMTLGRNRVSADACDGAYGWPIRLMCVVAVLAYFIAGVTKMRHAGIAWITSDTLLHYVAYDNVRKIELGASYSYLGALAVRFEWLFRPLAVGSLVLELGAPLALMSDRLGRWWCAGMWSFHLGVLLLMFIFFHYPLLGFAFAPFFAVERLSDRIANRFAKAARR